MRRCVCARVKRDTITVAIQSKGNSNRRAMGRTHTVCEWLDQNAAPVLFMRRQASVNAVPRLRERLRLSLTSAGEGEHA